MGMADNGNQITVDYGLKFLDWMNVTEKMELWAP